MFFTAFAFITVATNVKNVTVRPTASSTTLANKVRESEGKRERNRQTDPTGRNRSYRLKENMTIITTTAQSTTTFYTSTSLDIMSFNLYNYFIAVALLALVLF